MDIALFTDRMNEAVATAIELTRRMSIEDLPQEHRFMIIPNDSYNDSLVLSGAEYRRADCDYELIKDSSFLKDSKLGPYTLQEAIMCLWREGRVPIWITMTVGEIDAPHTILYLRTSAITTAHESMLKYPLGICPLRPFRCASPAIPPWAKFKDGFVDKKFPFLWKTECWDPYIGFSPNEELSSQALERRNMWRESQAGNMQEQSET